MNPNQNIQSQAGNKSQSTIILGVSAVALIGGGILLAAFLNDNSSSGDTDQVSVTPTPTTSNVASPTSTTSNLPSPTSTTSSSASPTPTLTSTNIAVMQMYKDGVFNGSGTYRSPGGTEGVSLKVTLQGDIIKDIIFTGDTDNKTSEQYQKIFADNYKSLVVGKKIDQVQLSRVSGSSLTSSGFNLAIQQIKNQAKI